ncbi:MAG: glutamate synthase large subunit [Candidatus Omnitrophota bacterium]
MTDAYLPKKQGLYDPAFEHDACGVGFVCQIKGKASYEVIKQGLEILRRLSHRGATGADTQTGDGAGLLIQIPHEFLNKACIKEKINLPAKGSYGTGLVFLPQDKSEQQFCKEVFSRVIEEEGQALLGWRPVPVEISSIGKTARESTPVFAQVFIGKNSVVPAKRHGGSALDGLNFERKLYLIRKKIENVVRKKTICYITNISSRTLSYKGLLMPEQLEKFFLDFNDADLKSAICLVHSRYSTNTFPTWDLSQPFRFLAHNGEINTLRGNINWMRAREGLLKSNLFGQKLKKLLPIIVPDGSDSSSLDNVFELLTLSGRPLAHAMMMLVPVAWEKDTSLNKKVKDFYKYHSCLMEPWDGPAAIAFTDGHSVGAVLDRNGLRPARYIVTKNDYAIMASEVGVLDIAPSNIITCGRLEPGKIFFIDTIAGRIVSDKEIKTTIAGQQDYGTWLKKYMLELKTLPSFKEKEEIEKETLELLKAFGYTREDIKVIIKPMAEFAQEPIGSMGNDTPHAILSKRPQLLYNYFKQLFAQVTNPAIDPIREEIVMSLVSLIGPERNLLEETPQHCHKLRIEHPILTNDELGKIKGIKKNSFKTKAVSLLFPVEGGSAKNFMGALDRICKETAQAVKDGYTFVILSDRGVDKDYAALPCLLAVGCLHHYLVKNSLRKQVGIILETAEPREVHHFALLFGYGADCINPYLAFSAIEYLLEEEKLNLDLTKAAQHYIKAVEKGILKILSKMGISTLQSYRGAQIFEALGLDEEVIERCFYGTVSRISGAGFTVIREETLLRHKAAYSQEAASVSILSTGGVYQWKKDGEFHLWNPESITSLQQAVWKNDFSKYQEFAQLINEQQNQPVTLRSLFKFNFTAKPIALNEVEPIESIVKRFATGAMSFGSISKAAHETIAIAMNRIGGRSNSGEGGEDPARFIALTNGDCARSGVKQVASGRFGVTTNYLINADELQIKISQGAKPGEGGQLPGHKVSAIIAKTRYTTPGVTLISPPPHHDIYSIEDLAQLIFDLKNTNPYARISVKLVSEAGVGTVAAGVAKGHADKILISGGDGGTGASPASSIKHAGLPWELGLSETHQTLVLNNLRGRVRLQTDGQMRTGRDVAIAALLGAEEFGFASVVLVTLGCVMLRHCHLNNCSVGIATQEEVLCQRFLGRPEYIINYFYFVAEELRRIMASLGIKSVDEMIGRTEFLKVNKEILPWKAKNIDFTKIFYKPLVANNVPKHYIAAKNNYLQQVLDTKLIELAKDALEKKQPTKIKLIICNTDRATGAMLSGKVCKAYGEEGLPQDTLHCKFKGIAGQSFGAFLAKGITFELEGMANDYVGKGISGGKIIIYPDRKTDYQRQNNVIIGNTAFYGAISGEAYISGVAGERFCIRNSGLYAVVEGVGDHACEYMTGGRVVILGATGRNFAAGMSGGIAYVFDPGTTFKSRCNLDMVELQTVSSEDQAEIYNLVSLHYKYTKSPIAKDILACFGYKGKKFVKVMPLEYKRILTGKQLVKRLELT